MKRVEFFYDYASTYSYLAHREIERIATERAAELVFKPMVLGFVFKASGNSMPAAVPAKAAYMVHDVRRWVRHYGLPFHMPSVFPVNTIRALRTAVAALEEGTFPAYHHAVMQEYWANDQDIGDAEVLTSIVTAAGLDGPRLVARAEEPSVKDRLKANTDEAIKRGVFGAPTFFVGDEMFWGNDRLHFVDEALTREILLRNAALEVSGFVGGPSRGRDSTAPVGGGEGVPAQYVQDHAHQRHPRGGEPRRDR